MANERMAVTAPRSQVTVDAAVSRMTAGWESHIAPSGVTCSSVSRPRSRLTSCHELGRLWARRLPAGHTGTGDWSSARADETVSTHRITGKLPSTLHRIGAYS